MTKNITKKIVGWEVVKKDCKGNSQNIAEPQDNVLLNRPEVINGSTYKIEKSSHSEHAFYVTINNTIINGKVLPFEIFINSKNMENFSWIIALTRVISAVFRHGKDATFLVEELRSVIDPRGGYYRSGGKYIPSLVAEIGGCVETHMVKIGLIDPPLVSEDLKSKRKEAESKGIAIGSQCLKCSQFAVARLDGCDTCLSCGWSKCG